MGRTILKIHKWLRKVDVTMEELYGYLDKDNNGLLSPDEFSEYVNMVLPGYSAQEIFDKYDVNKDGNLDKHEAKQAFTHFLLKSVNEEAAKNGSQEEDDEYADVQLDSEDLVGLSERDSLMKQLNYHWGVAVRIFHHLRRIGKGLFRLIDDDGNGLISKLEADSWFKKYRPDIDASVLFAKFDQDQDGFISFEELMQALSVYALSSASNKKSGTKQDKTVLF